MPRAADSPRPILDEAQAIVADLPADADGVVIGAPGTGKTHVLAARAVRLLREGIRTPDELVILTPSRRTATLLRDDVALRADIATPGALARSLGSLAFQVVRAAMVRAGEPAPQLLTGADQDRIIADLLAGDVADEQDGAAARWPESLPSQARASKAFRSELRTLIAECTELGVAPAELAALGRAHDRPEWTAAAAFLDDYRGVIAQMRSAHRDAADLLAEAARLLRDAPHGAAGEAELGPIARLRTVLIDDAQELTRGGIELVDALRSRGVAVLAFGDPDIGSGAFRGVTAELFARLAGMLGAVHVLAEVHRGTPALARLTSTVTQAIGVGGRVEHRRDPGPETPDPRVSAILAGSPFEEVDAIARALRAWHVLEDVAWGSMAVIAHDTRQVASLEAELAAREVPTRAAGVQRPLGRERIVRELLELVSLAAVPAGERDPEMLAAALQSPFGGLDAVGLRRLRAALRHRELDEGGTTAAGELLRDAMAHPLEIGSYDLYEARIAERLATTLQRLTEAFDRGETVHELLWLAWDRARVDGERLADRWRQVATTPGPAAAETGRALDALVALFEAAKRAVERGTEAGAIAFIRTILESDVPEDTLATPDRPATVTLLTPATALGTEFDAVVIAGVQDGVWPNVRLRGGMLAGWMLADVVEASRAGAHVEPPAAVDRRRAALHDELRLFVRAVSRATTRLLVTAVDDDDTGPSALFSFLPTPTRPEEAGAAHPLTLRGFVAQYRRTLTSETTPPVAAHAAGQLRALAAAGVAGAAPDQWYGVAEPTSTGPLRDPVRSPIPVSPSTIERFESCGIDWAIRALGGDTRSWSGGLGTILHAAMELVPDGDIEGLQQVVDERWGELEFEAPWLSAKERIWARTLVGRLASYLRMFERAEATRVGAEAEFEIAVPLRADATDADVIVRDRDAGPAGLDPDVPYAVLRGSIDRVEVYAAGTGEGVPRDPADREAPRVMVADLKTGRTPKKYRDEHVADDAQLSAYQLAVRAGAVPGIEPSQLAGARLILLSQLTKGADYRFAMQAALAPDHAAAFTQRVVTDATGMASAHFHGDIDTHCLSDRFAVCTVHTVKPVSAS